MRECQCLANDTYRPSRYYGPLVSCGNAPYWVGHHHTMVDGVQAYLPPGSVLAHCGTSDEGRMNATTGKIDCVLPGAR